MNLVDLALHMEAGEQRQIVFLGLLDALGMARHQHLHEVLGVAVALLAADQHFINVARIHIPHRALDQIAFLIDQGRGL